MRPSTTSAGTRQTSVYFTAIIMSATGGLAHEATVFYKRLAFLLSAKWGDEYSVVLGWLRCCLGFSLLHSAIQCIRGARSSIGTYTRAPPPMDFEGSPTHKKGVRISKS